MDVSRAEKVAEFAKELKTLGKDIKKPSTLQILPKKPVGLGPSRLPEPVKGSWALRMLMYFVAGLLAIGLILLAVDNWVTPIFQRVPGGSGYIPIPGTDTSQVYWKTNNEVANIIVGIPPTPPVAPSGLPAAMLPPSTTVIEGQSNYSITMDVYIADEYPQSFGSEEIQRVFFMLGASIDHPTLQVSLDNSKNTAHITVFNSEGLQESVEIENVPIHKPFRIGLVKSPYIMEGYLNGMLVMTRQLRSVSKIPTTGDKIFSPANIISASNTLSRGIKVLNVRTFGYVVPTNEMKGRMNDLVETIVFVPPVTK